VIETAKKKLGHGIRRDEAEILTSGKGIFADSQERDPVTGIYNVHRVENPASLE
jgi:hypothetical protein